MYIALEEKPYVSMKKEMWLAGCLPIKATEHPAQSESGHGAG